jgi:hypothetical protein
MRVRRGEADGATNWRKSQGRRRSEGRGRCAWRRLECRSRLNKVGVCWGIVDIVLPMINTVTIRVLDVEFKGGWVEWVSSVGEDACERRLRQRGRSERKW